MQFKQWLAEMPIQNLQHLGNWEQPKKTTPAYDRYSTRKMGWYKDDMGILTNPNAIEKIKRKWSKCPQPFDVYVVRSKLGAKYHNVGEVGADYLEKALNIDIEPSTIAITILFTNNVAADRMPFTAWTMAHRFGHAIARGRFSNKGPFHRFVQELDREMRHLLDMVYGYNKDQASGNWGYHDKRSSWERERDNTKRDNLMLKSLAMGIGTMKSARDRLLRNYEEEFYCELIAQYIIEGKVTFNPLPQMLTTHHAWGHPQGIYGRNKEKYADYIKDHMEPTINHYIEVVLNGCIGHVFML